MSNAEFKAIRNHLGLTQAQLAALLGYHGAMAVSVYERATNPRPVPDLLARLMIAYRDGYRPDNWPPSAAA
jgi:transcriptional regulator with XRE-family HTH domain